MSHLYQIMFSRLSKRRTTNKRTRRVVAPDLPEAIERCKAKADRAHPGATVIIETVQVYNHETESWERIATQ